MCETKHFCIYKTQCNGKTHTTQLLDNNRNGTDSICSQWILVQPDGFRRNMGDIPKPPIAKIFMDRKVGDCVTLKLGKAEKQFEIVSIKY